MSCKPLKAPPCAGPPPPQSGFPRTLASVTSETKSPSVSPKPSMADQVDPKRCSTQRQALTGKNLPPWPPHPVSPVPSSNRPSPFPCILTSPSFYRCTPLLSLFLTLVVLFPPNARPALSFSRRPAFSFLCSLLLFELACDKIFFPPPLPRSHPSPSPFQLPLLGT